MTDATFKHTFSRENPGKIDDIYVFDSKVLGKGSYGKVQKVQHKTTKAVRAVKIIDQKAVKDKAKFEKEVNIQAMLDHPHIVKLYEFFSDARKYYLVMEVCTGGELFDRIITETEKHEGQAFGEERAASYMQQIVGAMLYLHNKSFAHRDIKPENFLMQNAAEDAPIKVIDFGLATQFEAGKPMKTKAGTPYYVAPEVLGASGYNEKCDVWSCGVITYIILCGYPPFYGDSDPDILKSVKKGVFDFPSPDWDNVSQHGKTFIEKMLTLKPDARPSFEELISNIWLTDHSEKGTGTIVADFGGRLKKFQGNNKLKQLALTAIATQLKDEDIADLKATFETLDADKSGTLTIKEILEGIEQHKVDIPEDMQAVLAGLDTDGSGTIDYTEFIAATMEKKVYATDAMMWAAFRTFDLDGDGVITKAELKKAMSDGVDDTALIAMIAEADINGDGEISFEEFKTMIKKD